MSKYFFTVIAAGTLLMITVMNITSKPLKTAATPLGILNLEFACNSQQASDIIHAWQPGNKLAAAEKNTIYDFLFIFFYTIFLMQGCKMVAKRYSGVIQQTGLLLSSCAIAAGLLDVLENVGMLMTLHGHINNGITLVTVMVSVIKWMLAALCLLYFIIFGVTAMFKKAVK
jgi:hypothetical protein